MFGRSPDLFDACFRPMPGGRPQRQHATAPVITLSALPPSRLRHVWQDGEKFAGGFGPTDLLTADYWTLRARSTQLFETNIYARGLIRRLVTNEINTGLHLEATPEESILGMPEDSLGDWSEFTENRFRIYEKAPRLCDHHERLTFGALQAAARAEALIAGDVLVVLQQDPRTGLPRVRLIGGASVQTPLNARPRNGHEIRHGVEIDKAGRHVAYWINQVDRGLLQSVNQSKRLPAFGERSRRRMAWLLYGTDRRLDDVRGKPILSLILQSMREIDRYRDSVQRKATINAMVAMFIKKGEPKIGTLPITGGAIRKGLDVAVDNTGTERTFRVSEQNPGMVMEELQHGEEPVAFPSHGTDEKFAEFEEAIVQAVAWANEIPPEILRLSFSSNYSASQAAINEFKMYLNKVRTDFGDNFCQRIYVEWLVSEVLNQKIEAAGLIDSWRDTARYDEFAAWSSADWTGHIKPAVDVSKLVRGYGDMLDRGLITYDRAARELTGTKFSKNVQKMRRESEQLAEALRPIVELNRPPTPPAEGAEEQDRQDAEEDSAAAVVRLRALEN